MKRILGIDYGKKRTGISTTDPLQIIVTGLDTVDTKALRPFLEKYLRQEAVEKIVIGLPYHKDGTPTVLHKDIAALAKWLNKLYPAIIIDYIDESFTSVDAKEIILSSGTKRKKRRDKSLVDKVSAILILQKYLGHI